MNERLGEYRMALEGTRNVQSLNQITTRMKQEAWTVDEEEELSELLFFQQDLIRSRGSDG